jgi:hypothetical protein
MNIEHVEVHLTDHSAKSYQVLQALVIEDSYNTTRSKT